MKPNLLSIRRAFHQDDAIRVLGLASGSFDIVDGQHIALLLLAVTLPDVIHNDESDVMFSRQVAETVQNGALFFIAEGTQARRCLLVGVEEDNLEAVRRDEMFQVFNRLWICEGEAGCDMNDEPAFIELRE